MKSIRYTTCGMCGYNCGMKVTLEDGKITNVGGIPGHLNSRGGLCPKGVAAAEYEYDPKRITRPLLNVNKRGDPIWKEIDWDQALKIISDKLQESIEKYGERSVVWHRGAGPRWGSNWRYVQRFMNALGSPNYGSHDHLCYTPRLIGHKATYGGMPIPDYENANLIILWGFNPMASALPIQGRRIVEAISKGTKLIVIDPRFSSSASKASLFIQPRPGTDGALALGIAKHIIDHNLYDDTFVSKWSYGFEKFRSFLTDYSVKRVSKITGVPTDKICDVAEMYANRSPGAVLEDGNGIEQHTNVVQTTRALAALRVITGNLGAKGGNIFPADLELNPIAELPGTPNISKRQAESISNHPLFYALWGVSTPEIIEAIETGKPYRPRALIIQGSSMATVASNTHHVKETMKKLDFIATHDLYLTASAELSDLVLPATTFFEYTHFAESSEAVPAVNSRVITLAPKVVDPPGECWSDPKLIFNLAHAMGLKEEFPWKNEVEAINKELEPQNLTVKKLMEHPEGFRIRVKPSKVYAKHEESRFNTPTGKAELYAEEFAENEYFPLPRYEEPAESPSSTPVIAEKFPLVCGTGLQLREFTHTQFRTLPSISEIFPEPFAEIHPSTAELYHVNDLEKIIIESPRGHIHVRAFLSYKVPKNTVLVAHGWGQPYAEADDDPDNILTDDEKQCPISSATGNKSFLCRIHKGGSGE